MILEMEPGTQPAKIPGLYLPILARGSGAHHLGPANCHDEMIECRDRVVGPHCSRCRAIETEQSGTEAESSLAALAALGGILSGWHQLIH